MSTNSSDLPPFLGGMLAPAPASNPTSSLPRKSRRRRVPGVEGTGGLAGFDDGSSDLPGGQSPVILTLEAGSGDSKSARPRKSGHRKQRESSSSASNGGATPGEQAPGASPSPKNNGEEEAATQRVPTLDASSVTPEVHDQMLRSTIIRCMRGLGIEENQLHQFMSQIKKASTSVSSRLLVHPPTQQIFKKIVCELVFPYLDQQIQTHRLVRIQSLFRQRLARRTYLQLKKTYTGTQLGIRLDLFRSIVRGERESMAALNRLIRVYYRPLCQEAQKKAGIVSARDVSCLFSNLPLIVKRFKAAYAMLLSLRERNWPAVTGLDTHFSNILSLFDLIVLHAANIQFINDTLESMLTTNPKFAAFSKKALLEHPGLGHFDFPTLLRWPLQHAQSLNARLEAYLAYTPETADFLAEREQLQQVCDRLRSYSAQITRAEEGSTERARVLNIERQLSYETDGLDQALQLSADTHRYFVREGSIIYFDAKKKSSERHLFMFNDLLILAKGHAPSYHIGAADVLKLDAYSLMDNVDLEVELGLKGVKPEQFPVFKLVLESATTPLDAARSGASSSSGGINPQSVGQTEPVFYLSAPSSAEKQVWFMKLKKQKQVNEQVFGVDLAELLANESVSDPDGIPKVVRFSCNQLQARGLLSVGLFRVSPDKSALNQMIREFNRGLIRTEESLAARDPAVMSEVLKVFFRSLPEPLMTYKLSETLARAEDAIDPVSVLDALPPQNRTILDFLMNFLARVCQHSDVNKMTPANVAIVFGPNLIREKVDSLESSMRMSKVLAATEAIVYHYFSLCRDPPLEVVPVAPELGSSFVWPEIDSSDEESDFDPYQSSHLIPAKLSLPPTPVFTTPTVPTLKGASTDRPGSTSAFPGIRVIEVDAPTSSSSKSSDSTLQKKLKKASRKGVSASLSFKRKNRPTVDGVFQ